MSSNGVNVEADSSILIHRLTDTFSLLKEIKDEIKDSRQRMEQRQRNLFVKCVRCQQAKNTVTAIDYAVSCARVRRIAQKMYLSQLSLEQAFIRVRNAGDFYEAAAGIRSIIRRVRSCLADVIPEISSKLGRIEGALDGLLSELNEASSRNRATSTGENSGKTFYTSDPMGPEMWGLIGWKEGDENDRVYADPSI